MTIPCTYAGGAKGELKSSAFRLVDCQLSPVETVESGEEKSSQAGHHLNPDISDLALVDRLSNGKVDLTYGS